MKHALTGSRCTRQTSPAAFGPLRTFAGCRFSFVGVSRRSRSAVYSPGRLQRRVGARTTEHQRHSLAAGGTRRGRFLGRRGTQPRGRRAQRASSTFWPRLSERRERSERSEFRGPTPGRVPQGSRRVQRRPPQHEPPPGTACREARQREEVGNREATTAMGRKPTTNVTAHCVGPAPGPARRNDQDRIRRTDHGRKENRVG